MNKGLIGIAVAAALVGGWSFSAGAERASACSLAPMDIESGFANADVVAIGTLRADGELAGVFEVEQYFSGSETTPTISFDNRSPEIGADCSLDPTNNPNATDGRYLAFLDATGSDETGAYRAGWYGSGMLAVVDGKVSMYDMQTGDLVSLTVDEVRERLEEAGGVAVSPVATDGEAAAGDSDDSSLAWLVGGGIVAVAAVSGGAVALKKGRG